jgi:hypothetical protein
LLFLPDPSFSGPLVLADGEEASYLCKMAAEDIMWTVTSYSGAEVPFLIGMIICFSSQFELLIIKLHNLSEPDCNSSFCLEDVQIPEH